MSNPAKQSRYLEAFEHNAKGLHALSTGAWPLDTCQECKGSGKGDDGDTCYTCDGIGKVCECSQCSARGDEDSGERDEGGFSWSSCDTCGSSLGGDRYPGHALDRDPQAPGYVRDSANIIHLEVCADCLMFIANGDEPEASDEDEQADE